MRAPECAGHVLLAGLRHVTLRLVPPRPECTGLSASWCPNHGDCTCGLQDQAGLVYDGGRTLTDEDCPLHSPSSPHAEPPNQKETLF